MSAISVGARTLPVLALVAGAVLTAPTANADNIRLNNSVIANVYTIQHQAGCTNNVTKNPQLQLAAEWHANDVLNNRALDGDLGSDGSTPPQSRAAAAGYKAPSRRPSRSTRRSPSTASRS